MTYLTMQHAAAAEIEVKKSRFLAVIDRAPTESDAAAVLAAQRRLHHAARHHCSAFIVGCGSVVGSTDPIERADDDGEPAGTAGTPMLDVLRGRGLGDVVAVVTRYFGGTLLGAGGLVRAYSDAVTAALEAAVLIRRRPALLWAVIVDHGPAAQLESGIRAKGFGIERVEYAERAEVTVIVDADREQAFIELIAVATSGVARPRLVGRTWVDEVLG